MAGGPDGRAALRCGRAGSLRRVLKRAFAGDAVSMFQHLIRESNLSADDLNELKRMIEQKEQEGRR